MTALLQWFSSELQQLVRCEVFPLAVGVAAAGRPRHGRVAVADAVRRRPADTVQQHRANTGRSQHVAMVEQSAATEQVARPAVRGREAQRNHPGHVPNLIR